MVGGAEWRDLMEPTHAVARRFAAAGRVEIVQGGEVVEPTRAADRSGSGVPTRAERAE